MRRIFLAFLVFTASIVLIGIASSQTTDDEPPVCQKLAESGYSNLQTNCGDMPGGSVCSGSGAVTLQASPGEPNALQPGDITPLKGVQIAHTQGFDLDGESWGLGAMTVYANIPRALSELGVRYFLLGDVEVENLVPQELAFEPVAPIPVTALVPANLRAFPNPDSHVEDNAPVGSELLADGLSLDSQWLRVLKDVKPLWVSRQLVASGDRNLDELPVLEEGTQSLMQSICLRTGQSDPTCRSIPAPILLVQGPEAVRLVVNINGIEFSGRTTFALRTLPDNVMQLFVLQGTIYTGRLAAPEGFTATIPLSAQGCGVDGGWSNLHPIDSDERAMLEAMRHSIPPDLLYVPFEVPSEEDVAAIEQALAGGGGARSTGLLDCRTLRPTSPQPGIVNFGNTTFYWDGVPGADNYRVYVRSSQGDISGPFETGSANTNLTLYTGGFAGGPEYDWYVEALVKGQLACTSDSWHILRAEPPAGDVPLAGGGQPVSGGGGVIPPTDTPGPPATSAPPTNTPGPLPSPPP